MFSGYLMAAVYHLDRKGGFAGWQWFVHSHLLINPSPQITNMLNHRLFIVDGIISLPIALAGYFIFPDVPEISRPFYLTKEVSYMSYTSK